MARPPSKGTKGFIWLPKEGTPVYDIKINGVSVREDYISAEFTKYALPEIGSFSVVLINVNAEYTDVFQHGDEVQLVVDYVDGTTLNYLGKIDKIDQKQGDGIEMIISGGHISIELSNICY